MLTLVQGAGVHERRSAVRPGALLPLVLFTVTAVSCSLMGPTVADGDSGTLTVSVAMPAALTIAPSIDMTPASYRVQGSGPNGRSFSVTTTSTSVSRSGLKSGTWTVSVSALNASAAVIAAGSGSVSISGGSAAYLSVTVAPLPGNGTLTVSVTWNSAAYPNASVTGQVLPPAGAATALVFTASGPGAASASTSVTAGYSTLTVQLVSAGAVVMGAVDVARIVQGQTTYGSYDFTQASATGGTLALTAAAVDTSPLQVSLSGQASTLASGSTMTVTASVANDSGNVSFVWYLNGARAAAGSTASPSLTLGGNLAAGTYRLDVAAFSADGLRAGAATCAFTLL